MSAELDRLKASVTNIRTVADSAAALMSGLSARIRELKDDPVQLAALADELDAEAGQLGAAIAENTPAE